MIYLAFWLVSAVIVGFAAVYLFFLITAGVSVLAEGREYDSVDQLALAAVIFSVIGIVVLLNW